MSTALILFAHGSSDPNWAAPFAAVRAKVLARRPTLHVEIAFLERMQPDLGTCIDALVRADHAHVVVAPLFMGQGAHLKRDLARLVSAVRQRHPHLRVDVLPAAGEVDPLLDAMCEWLVEAVSRNSSTNVQDA